MNGMASGDSRAGARGPEQPPPSGEPASAPLGPIVALSVAIAVGVFLILAPIARHLLPVTELRDPFADQHQDAETLMFVVAFAVLLPLSVIVSARIADRVSTGPNRSGFSALCASLSAALAVVLLVTRLSERFEGGGGETVLVAGALLWCALAAAALWRAASPRPWGLLGSASGAAPILWAVAALLVLGVVVVFTTLDSISPVVLAVGLALTAAVLFAEDRVRIPAPPRSLGATLDVGVIVLLLFAVPNLVVFVLGDPAETYKTSVTQFHQNFYLGPANQLLAGDAMLVDTLSQYGVGSIYFLAGAFNVVPIGNGTLGLIEGLLSALMFIGAYAAIRVAGVSRLLAASAMALAVVVLVYGLEFPLGALLQHGAFRFGLPVGVILGAVAEARWPQAAGPARGLQLLTIGVASVWALEGFAYTLLTVLAIIAFRVVALPAAERRRELVGWAVGIAGACVIAHLLLAAATLVGSGELPDWGWYLNTLREFLTGQVGELTYDFSRWSPGLALGPLYLASAAAVTLIFRRRPDLIAAERTMLIAIAGMTAFGVALLSYLVNRSADHIIPYVSLPAVALGALWLELLRRPRLGLSDGARRAALGLGLTVSTLLVAVAASSVDTRFSQSGLGLVLPGGDSFRQAIDRLWDPPAVRPIAPEGEQLLAAHMPRERRSIVLTSPDPGLEILLRSDRASAVPFGDPYEDSFVPEGHIGPLGEFVETLEVGDRMLIDPAGREVFELYRREPSRDPFTGSAYGAPAGATGLTTLQEWVLREIGRRYDLRKVARSAAGLEVVELVPRRIPA
jgi:hypothetical protein